MPTVESPPEDELDSQSAELAAALTTAVAATATAFAAEVGAGTVGSLATTSVISSLWAARIEGAALALILDAYLDAAGSALETVDPDRRHGLSLVDDDIVQQFVHDARKNLASLGTELEQLARTVINTALQAGTVVQDILPQIKQTMALPTHRVVLVAQATLRAAVESGTLAQMRALSKYTRVTRIWKSKHDERTRSWHRAASGQVVGVGESFHVGNSWLLAPSVPAPGRSFDVGDVCNCRCTTIYDFDIITSVSNASSMREMAMAVPQPSESALTAAAGKWNPSAHPRGKDGRFIKKGALSTLLSTKKPNIGHVLEGVLALDAPQWNNLTDAQKTYIKDSVEKLPAASQAYKASKATLAKLDALAAPSAPVPTPTPVSVDQELGGIKSTADLTATDAEAAAVVSNFKNGSYTLNAALRSGEKLTPQQESTVQQIDVLMAKSSANSSFSVFRGVLSPSSMFGADWNNNASNVGLTYTDNGFVSSTTNKDTAKSFGLIGIGTPTGAVNHPTVVTVHALKGTHAIKVDTTGPNQEEVLLERGMNYRITEDHGVIDGVHQITVEATLPAPAPTSTPAAPIKAIPAHKGAKPGTPAKVSTALAWGKYDDGDVILESATGDKRVIWDGKAKKYATQDKLSDGTWQSTKFESKKDFYANNKGDDSYVVPGAATTATPAPTPSIAPVAVEAPSVSPTITAPEVSEPTQPQFESGTFATSASVIGYSNLKAIISSAPPNTVIAEYTPGIIDANKNKRRIVSMPDGTLHRQVQTASGQWDDVSEVTTQGISSELMSYPNWKISQDIIPSVVKPSGSSIDNWATHMAQNFAFGDVVATHESGLQRVVRSGATHVGTVYDVQTFDLVSDMWKVEAFDNTLSQNSFINGAFALNRPGPWIAGTPSAPAVTAPQPSVPESVTQGGVPLQYMSEDVISSMTNTLNKTSHIVGDVIAIHSSGNYRITAQELNAAFQPTYRIDRWNPTSGKWTATHVGNKTPYKTYDSITNIVGPWLAPLPNGQSYAPKSMSTPTPTPTVNVSTNPLGVGSDITGISLPTKTAMKATLKPDKVGYWSKPEKIWDSIKKIQDKYPDPANPGHSQYSAMQVLKSLDSTLKVSDPSPFETKMTKWAATPKGQAYIKKSLQATAPTVTPTTVTPTTTSPTVPTPPSVSVNIGTDDISHLTLEQKNSIYAAFKKQQGTFSTSPPLSIYNALKKTSLDNNLSVMQTLKAVDDVGAKNAGVTNSNLFEKKITEWLSTKKGTLAAQGKLTSELLSHKLDYSPSVSPDAIPTFDKSSVHTYNIISKQEAHAFDQEVLKMSELPSSQLDALKKYSGSAYTSINSYLYGDTDSITPINMNAAKNIQKAMRPSNKPMLLHRGVGYSGIANSTGFDDLQSKVGQTWMSGGFFSTSVGGQAAFSHNPVRLEVEAPPGTPMAWMEHIIESASGKKTLTMHPGEREMLLAAGLSYRIISVTKDHFGNAIVRLRVVPPSEEVTV